MIDWTFPFELDPRAREPIAFAALSEPELADAVRWLGRAFEACRLRGSARSAETSSPGAAPR